MMSLRLTPPEDESEDEELSSPENDETPSQSEEME
jgi:hypothetical protein